MCDKRRGPGNLFLPFICINASYKPVGQECHDEEVDIVVDVPKEYCDIIPHKTCSQATKLVPNLKPSTECNMVPTEVCTMNYAKKKIVEKPLKTEWCLDQNDVDTLMLPEYRKDEIRK